VLDEVEELGLLDELDELLPACARRIFFGLVDELSFELVPLVDDAEDDGEVLELLEGDELLVDELELLDCPVPVEDGAVELEGELADEDEVAGGDPAAPPAAPPADWAWAATVPATARLTATAMYPTLFICTPGD
jgi:hypothetical protein